MTYFLENDAHRTRIVGYRWARIGLTALGVQWPESRCISSQLLPSLATTGETQQITALTSANLPALQTQISLSTAITALPSNLTPKLAKVAKDWPDSYENGCFAALATRSRWAASTATNSRTKLPSSSVTRTLTSG